MTSRNLGLIALLATVVSAAPAEAATVWDESTQGDLASAAGAPTSLTFGPGSNVVAGTVVSPADTRDFLRFTISSGFQLTSLGLLSYDDLGTSQAEDGNRGYHAISSGTSGLVPSPANTNAFLGGNHLDPLPVGSNLLPLLGGTGRLAGSGFSGPLAAGDYVYLVQQTGAQLSAYRLDFVVTPVPVPAALWFATSALATLAGFRRARR